ncbi:MAG TPA: putative oxidoreductase C-terminal domain-containing protein [Puia sp.]|nr:putative oxidoreductase C-terminal domain-containing protein [Puia sp.]
MPYHFRSIIASLLIVVCGLKPCKGHAQGQAPIRLITLDPGHFHAALVQKTMYGDIDPIVHVYAPAGPDVQSHLDKIAAYNSREKDPTHWVEKLYTGNDFLQKMIGDKAGNTVILAGNNLEKTSYILQSLQAGFHVLGDKPMVIDDHAFTSLLRAFDTAAAHKTILYDIMTERYEITCILQRELAMDNGIFGTLEKGSPSNPAVIGESAHRWYKYVSGNVLTRPAWSFDVSQQGEGIVDVMTHLVDLVQWECFPDQVLDYKKDVTVNSARHWTTDLTLSQFKTLTKENSFPGYLKKNLTQDTILKVYANGQIDYRLRGVYVRTTATWTYKGPTGADDTYCSLVRGSKANLIIRQGEEQQYHSTLYIEPVKGDAAYEQTLTKQFARLQNKYPGLSLKKEGTRWEVIIPDSYKEGHEAHFGRVTEKFLGFVKNNNMPAWEVPGIIAKYYTTTKGLELARLADSPIALKARFGDTNPLPADTLVAQVTTHLNGSTRDLSLLNARVLTLNAGEGLRAGTTDADELIIIKDGSLSISSGDTKKTLGPGGIALLAAGDGSSLSNTNAAACNYFILFFKSRSSLDRKRAGPPVFLDWSDMPMKTTDKGESRQIFNQPVAWLSKIDMHATTLNEGQISHPPHTHRNEEIILMRSGNVQMYIGGKYYPARAGDIVFLTSGTPHNLENKTKGRCEYFALQWQQ